MAKLKVQLLNTIVLLFRFDQAIKVEPLVAKLKEFNASVEEQNRLQDSDLEGAFIYFQETNPQLK